MSVQARDRIARLVHLLNLIRDRSLFLFLNPPSHDPHILHDYLCTLENSLRLIEKCICLIPHLVSIFHIYEHVHGLDMFRTCLVLDDDVMIIISYYGRHGKYRTRTEVHVSESENMWTVLEETCSVLSSESPYCICKSHD